METQTKTNSTAACGFAFKPLGAISRQYLINFNAVKEVEHYFARKLLVHLTIPAKDKLLVSKEKVSSFLHWLDNR
jgi:two-component system response regulator LytT